MVLSSAWRCCCGHCWPCRTRRPSLCSGGPSRICRGNNPTGVRSATCASSAPSRSSSRGSMAKTALGKAGVALECFSDAKLAFEGLGRAVRLAPGLEEFGEFVADAPRLAAEADAAGAWLAEVDRVTRGGEHGQPGLLELAGEVALGAGRPALGASY